MEYGYHHVGGSQLQTTFDFLPHDAAAAHIRHQYYIGKNLDIVFKVVDLQVYIGGQSGTIEAAVVNLLNAVYRVAYYSRGEEALLQRHGYIFLVEGGDKGEEAAKGHFVGALEHIIQLKFYHCPGICQ